VSLVDRPRPFVAVRGGFVSGSRRSARPAAPVVALVVKSFPPAFRSGGPARSAAALASLLSDHFDVRVITSLDDNGYDLRADGVPEDQWVTREGVPAIAFAKDRWSGLRVVREVRRLRPSVLHLNSLFNPSYSLAPLLARRVGVVRPRRTVLAPRGELAAGALDLKQRKKRAVLWVLQHFGLTRGVVWHATSAEEEVDIHRVFGSSAEVRLAPVVRQIEPAAAKAVDRASAAGARPLEVVLLSKIDPMKNIETAITVIAAARTDAVLTVAGPVKDDAYWRECLLAVEEAGLADRFRYVGPVSPDEVVEFLRGFDLFLLPTLGENFGHVVLEALSAGVPVLLSDRTPWTDVVRGGPGWALPLSDVGAFSRVVEEFADLTPSERSSMAEAASRAAVTYMADDENRRLNLELFAPTSPQVAVVHYGFPVTTQTFHHRRHRVMLEDGVLQSIRFVRTRSGVLEERSLPLLDRAANVTVAELLLAVPHVLRGRVIAALVEGAWHARAHNGEGGREGFVWQAVNGVAIGRALRRSEATVVLAPFAAAAASVGLFASLVSGLPFAIEVHSPESNLSNPRLLAFKLRRADLVVAISSYAESMVRAHAPGVRTAIVHCGLDDLDDLEREGLLGKAAGVVTAYDVVSVGSLVPKKGHDVLVRASAALSQRVPHSVAIVGAGSLEADLRALIDEIDAPVSLLGELPPDEIQTVLVAARVSVLACVRTSNGDEDGVPVSLMEAMQLGVPVVSTRIAGIPELLDDGLAGGLVEPGDVAGLAGMVDRALTDTEWAAEVAAAGRRRVRQAFDNRTETRRMIGLLGELSGVHRS